MENYDKTEDISSKDFQRKVCVEKPMEIKSGVGGILVMEVILR
jgi:hypothetical protein